MEINLNFKFCLPRKFHSKCGRQIFKIRKWIWCHTWMKSITFSHSKSFLIAHNLNEGKTFSFLGDKRIDITRASVIQWIEFLVEFVLMTSIASVTQGSLVTWTYLQEKQNLHKLHFLFSVILWILFHTLK